MQLLCEAYIELAYVNVTQLKNERGTVRLAHWSQAVCFCAHDVFVSCEVQLNFPDDNQFFIIIKLCLR